eukprot:CAMPEP_0198281154 /NCGR_PEP_ID=MMETSP1449-20131203/1129_1 /TAXON_ID=420275 /ORGANISM="Attheya septentrionalis, Strain CCMP2084" /LENGTH=76 /DNA_ID=CAMNT_0043976793 /DNA_START=663 /DNA_END=893 /DNA_ORIENTATION=-
MNGSHGASLMTDQDLLDLSSDAGSEFQPDSDWNPNDNEATESLSVMEAGRKYPLYFPNQNGADIAFRSPPSHMKVA